MKRVIAVLMLLVSSAAYSKDYSGMLAGHDISWSITANDMQHDLRRDKTVFWLGVVKRVMVARNPSGKTTVTWLCEQHSFLKRGNSAAIEPVEVKSRPTGFFVVSMLMPSLSPDEVRRNVLDKLKEPQYVLLVGSPEQAGKFKGGVESVMMHADQFQISDEMIVRFVK